MDNDLISREAALNALLMSKDYRDAHDTLEQLPAVDAAPVVRCMDCKNWDNSAEGRYVGGWCFCEKLQFSTSPDWFCADGVREQNGTPE